MISEPADYLWDSWFEPEGNSWTRHHWQEWNFETSPPTLLDSWINHSPTIYGTGIAITPAQSFTELEEYILQTLRGD